MPVRRSHSQCIFRGNRSAACLFFGKDRQSHIFFHFAYLSTLFCATAAQQLVIMLNEHFTAIFTAKYPLFFFEQEPQGPQISRNTLYLPQPGGLVKPPYEGVFQCSGTRRGVWDNPSFFSGSRIIRIPFMLLAPSGACLFTVTAIFP